MADEAETPAEEEETEFAVYEPACVEVGDGAAVIGDVVAFLEEAKSVAVHMRDGQMWVLRERTLTWMKIEDVRKTDKKRGELASVKTAKP
jgi:hypothetical protein